MENENIENVENVVENNEVIEESKPTFVIPDEYKNKGWASQMHSIEDMCKKIDNQERYISKGQLPHRDSSESDIEAFTEKMKKYTSELDYSDLTGKDEDLAKALKESGVPKFQAKAVVNLIKGREAKEYGEEEFESLLKQKFNGREEDLNKAKGVLKEIGEEKTHALLSKRNDIVADVIDIIAEVGKKYGIKSATTMAKLGDTAALGGQGSEILDWSKAEVRAAYKKEMDAWYDNPQATEEQKRAIMKKYGRID